jgi:aspartate racemase
MKTVGMIGGIGPESTIDYYRQIIAAYRRLRKDGSYPSIFINSIDIKKMLALIGANELAAVTEYLLAEIQRLADAGANFAVLAANSPHLVFDDLNHRSPIPLISIVEAARDAAMARGLKHLGLIGARFTMQGRFYPEVFTRAGIALSVPNPDEQTYLHDKYMSELVNGTIVSETRQRFLQIVERLQERHGIEGLILGGTELPLILRDATHRRIPFLDTTKLHVERIVAQLLQEPNRAAPG